MQPLASRIFFLPDGRLRASWRFVIFVLSYLLASMALAWLWPVPENFVWRMIGAVAARLVVTLLISWIVLRSLERQPLSRIGIQRTTGWWTVLACGAIMGMALVGLTTAVLMLAAGVHFEPLDQSAALPKQTAAPALEFLQWTPFIFLAAASEELLIRGYPFRVLIEGAGALLAVVSNSLLFGLLHASNPEASVFSVVNTVLAGVLLSLACLRANSLWYAIGLHFSWNWTLAALGFPVSGLELPGLGWRAILPEQWAWLHGGAYGPEAGVVVTVALTIATLLLWFQPHLVGCRPLSDVGLPPSQPTRPDPKIEPL